MMGSVAVLLLWSALAAAAEPEPPAGAPPVTLKEARRLGFVVQGRPFRKAESRVIAPWFQVRFEESLPQRDPAKGPGPVPPEMPDPAALQALTERLYARFLGFLALEGWSAERPGPEALAALPPDERHRRKQPVVLDPSGFFPAGTPAFAVSGGVPRGAARLARLLDRDDVAFAATVHLAWCPVGEAVVPCVRGRDTGYGAGEPGLVLIRVEGSREVGTRLKPRTTAGLYKAWTWSRGPAGVADQPVLPAELTGDFADQAEDAVGRALELARRRAGVRKVSP